ncbi:MAG: cupredoxin domain-containing protein [bacterium]|nr:cupredoxin domain-containing protein [bacterium]
MLKRSGVVVFGVVVVAVLAACTGPSLDEIEPVVGAAEITVKDDYFEPRVVQVTPGTTITWTWDARRGHDLAANDFTTPVQREGTFEYSWDEPGIYNFICRLHAGMTGRVIVAE